ncbi:MAG TPA: hypothetical protein VE913_16910 [Longimicrobium sp.]|nr:hypothetical protein [Longimicrobium sp.]
MTRWAIVAGLVWAVGTASCGENPAGSGARVAAGQFHATISGAVNADVAGSASFEDVTRPAAGRIIQLVAEGESGEIEFDPYSLLSSNPGFRFPRGTHAVGVLSTVQGYVYPPLSDPDAEGVYIASTGRLEISESSADRVVGEFDFTALAIRDDNSRSMVRVRGAFHAVPLPPH